MERRPEPLVTRRTRDAVTVLTVAVADVYESAVIARLGHELRQAVEESGSAAYVLDLAPVHHLTSAALGLIINLRAHLVSRGYGFAIAGAQGEVAAVFSHTRLDRVMRLYGSVEEAVLALGCGG